MTQTFSERQWKQRERTLGDPAENAFEAWCKQRGHKCAPYGLRRPDVDLSYVPAFIRYTPDFLTQFGLVEVQGCGRDQTFKFKHDKLDALDQWSYQAGLGFGLRLFLWNQTIDQSVLVDFELLHELLLKEVNADGPVYRTDGVFDGTKPYVSITWDDLTSRPWASVA